jgi:hypothetical protein
MTLAEDWIEDKDVTVRKIAGNPHPFVVPTTTSVARD